MLIIALTYIHLTAAKTGPTAATAAASGNAFASGGKVHLDVTISSNLFNADQAIHILHTAGYTGMNTLSILDLRQFCQLCVCEIFRNYCRQYGKICQVPNIALFNLFRLSSFSFNFISASTQSGGTLSPAQGLFGHSGLLYFHVYLQCPDVAACTPLSSAHRNYGFSLQFYIKLPHLLLNYVDEENPTAV